MGEPTIMILLVLAWVSSGGLAWVYAMTTLSRWPLAEPYDYFIGAMCGLLGPVAWVIFLTVRG